MSWPPAYAERFLGQAAVIVKAETLGVDRRMLTRRDPPSALLDGFQTTDTLAVDGRAFRSLP
jgi:hypothetical protein